MTEEGVEKVKSFAPSKGLTTQEAEQLLEKWGRNQLEDKKRPKVRLFFPVSYCTLCLFDFTS
jgi:hypothetical protein